LPFLVSARYCPVFLEIAHCFCLQLGTILALLCLNQPYLIVTTA
jgi:hypothetical protein